MCIPHHMVALARNLSARRIASRDRRVDRRVEWYRCLKLDMHIIWKYVYIDAPGVLGVQYMYVCMHVCMYYVLCIMYYVCMYVCTLFGEPIAIRRADRRAGWYGCVSSWICMYYQCMYISTGSTIYVCMHACMYVLCMYACMYAIRRAIRRADR